MSYTLNSYDLLTKYGIRCGHAPTSNVSLQGCFDMPARIGITSHDWGDEDGIEDFSASGEIFYGGRDLNLHGSISGVNSVLNANLKTFYDDIAAPTGLTTLSTPYGDYSVLVRRVDPEYMQGGCSVVMNFREPVADLTGGTLPASGVSDNTIDSIPMLSFGLIPGSKKEIHSLPDLKEMQFTKFGAEGYQITKRKNKTLELSGFVIGSSLADFQSKIKALYKIFSSPGLRTVKINSEISVSCFATSGFTVDTVYIYSSGMAGKFKINLQVISVTFSVKYGYLYNWYAVNNASPIYAANAHVPTLTEMTALYNYVGGESVGGGVLKSITGWTDNVGALDSYGFNLKGSGYRSWLGSFSYIGLEGMLWTSTLNSLDASQAKYMYAIDNGTTIFINVAGIKSGLSVRLIVDTPIEISGTHAIYVGNDGRRYNCVLIDSVWWLAENLAETKYRDGTLILTVTNNTAWATLSTGAMCAYNNDETNVLE